MQRDVTAQQRASVLLTLRFSELIRELCRGGVARLNAKALYQQALASDRLYDPAEPFQQYRQEDAVQFVELLIGSITAALSLLPPAVQSSTVHLLSTFREVHVHTFAHESTLTGERCAGVCLLNFLNYFLIF